MNNIDCNHFIYEYIKCISIYDITILCDNNYNKMIECLKKINKKK